MISTRMKKIAVFVFAAVLCVLGAIPVFAASTVSSIKLTFKNNYEVGTILEPDITCSTSGVSIDSVTWSKDVEKWTPGKKVTATIVLTSDDGREFSSSYGSGTCKITGATLAGSTGSGTELTIKASYYPVVQLDSPDEAGWSAASRTTAVWKKVTYATGYQIRLYRDDAFVRTIDVTGTRKDLSEYMLKEADYYYEIRAVGKTTEDAKYRLASEYLNSTSRLMDDIGETDGTWKNYSEGKKYEAEDGTAVTESWYKIADKWYYFNSEGYMVTGWKLLNGLWYYMDQDGVMLTGWQKINDVWYYLNPDGDMATGWKEGAPGRWYYLNSDGAMVTDTVIDGKHIDSTGLCID